MLTNPPYGERIGVRGDRACRPRNCSCSSSAPSPAPQAALCRLERVPVLGRPGLPKLMRLKEARKTPFFNGALECRLFRFDMVAGYNRREEAKPVPRDSED
jgi:putative N6-adenine-specific DNA methylase